ncbi:MAG: hypothetical protein AABY13_00030 [Nanoarchaeota archaeon]
MIANEEAPKYNTTVHLMMPTIFRDDKIYRPEQPDTSIVCVCHTDDFVLLEELLEKEKIRSESFTDPLPQKDGVAYLVKRLEMMLGDMHNRLFTGICTTSGLFYMRAELDYGSMRKVREFLVGKP